MRTEFSKAVRVAAFQRCKGRCEECGSLLRPGRFTYDHRNPDFMGGAPTLDNCQVLCWGCDKPKTAKDQGHIAKAKRRMAREAGVRKPRSIRTWKKFDGTGVYAPRER